MHNRHSDEDFSKDDADWGCREVTDHGSVPFTTIRQLLEPREWHEADGLSQIDLIRLLNELEFDLLQNRIQVDFLDALPPRVAYKGILQLLDSPIALSGDAFTIQHLDGCDSACESCFQLAHCSLAREVLGNDWRLAVEQAGINPSWSALFAQEDEI